MRELQSRFIQPGHWLVGSVERKFVRAVYHLAGDRVLLVLGLSLFFATYMDVPATSVFNVETGD